MQVELVYSELFFAIRYVVDDMMCAFFFVRKIMSSGLITKDTPAHKILEMVFSGNGK